MDDEQRSPGDVRPRRRWVFGKDSSSGGIWLTAGAPLAISLISLALSFYTIFEASREQEIWLSAPDVVRVASGESAWFYVQPRLVSAARNDRVAVITSLRLEVEEPGGETPVTFSWGEQGTWEYDTESRGLTWIYQADPAPLVVGPSSPQLPICLFEGPADWVWKAGDYRVTIVAGREQNPDALRTTFRVSLADSAVEHITMNPRTWVGVPTEALPAPAQS
jgi:hypothetical protein